MLDLKMAVSRYGAEAKAKYANPGATGEPEEQLRAPFETLLANLAELCGFKREVLGIVAFLPQDKARLRDHNAGCTRWIC
jgi:hypothetical protein